MNRYFENIDAPNSKLYRLVFRIPIQIFILKAVFFKNGFKKVKKKMKLYLLYLAIFKNYKCLKINITYY